MKTPLVGKRILRLGPTAFACLTAFASIVMVSPATVRAQMPERRIEQYHHTRWTREDGAPEMVVAMTQSSDGFIWLASEQGLVRFDGLSFEQISPLAGDLSGPVSSVLVTRKGTVWAWLLNAGRPAVYENGRLAFVPSPAREGQVTHLLQAADGAIWAGVANVGQPLYRFADGQWQVIDATAGLRRSGLTGLLATSDGAIWAGYADYVLRLGAGADRFERVNSLQAIMGRIARDTSGRVWIVDGGAARPVSGPGGALPVPARPLRLPADDSGRPGRPLFDRQGNLWEATRSGLTRTAPSPTSNPMLDRFTAVQGLSANAAFSILEDREGNLWVGTVNGIDRFRRSAIVPEPGLSKPGRYGNIQLSTSDGTVFIAETDALYSIAPGGAPQVRLTGFGYPEGLCEGADGTIWLSSDDAIRGIRPGRPVLVLARPPGAQRDLGDCVDDTASGFQVTAGYDGVFRRTGEGWEPVVRIPEGKIDMRAIARDGAGRLWATLDGNAVGQWTPAGWQEVHAVDSPRTLNVLTLFPLSSGVLFAGRQGVSRYNPDSGVSGPVRAFREANGLVQSPNGDVWAFSRRGLVLMRAQAFARSLVDPAFEAPYRVFGPSDGLLSRHANQSWRSLVQGGDGRLWLATVAGTAWIDPARIPVNRLAPSIVITKLEARGIFERDPARLKLRAGTSDLSINFSVLNLGSPERVQVRYRLEGMQQGWVDPGQRRQAFFTNLKPGTYRFRVIAANEDGVWNRDGASLSFTIPPTFLQSIWFKFICVLAGIGLASAAYLLRMRQVTAELRDRFHIRIAERERIARELHDTWLQGVQGLVLSVQSVANRLPAGSELKDSVDTTLDRADGLIADGRRRLRDLRRRTADADFGQALADSAREVISSQSDARITIEGPQHPIDPNVAEELLRIAEEAMRNAVQHGDDVQVEIALVFAHSELRLSIQDDGPGLPGDVLASGQRRGHFGLLGMQERADRIGARLEISSQPQRGTEVRVTVPALRAYRDAGAFYKQWLIRWLRRLRLQRP